MADLLGTLSSMDRSHVTLLYGKLTAVAGQVHIPRLRAAFVAIQFKGTNAATFVLATWGDLRAIGYIDQIDIILHFVDSDFTPPAPIGVGDKFRIGGKLAVLHMGGFVRIGSPTYVAFNPGAIGSGPSFDLTEYGAYPGKTVGSARIAVFPDESAGLSGLYAWINFNVNRNMSFVGFFKAHAPKAKNKRDKANKGNDPLAYFRAVAKGMGYQNPDAQTGKFLSQVLAEKSIEDMARAMQIVEGWQGVTTTWADDKLVDNKNRFRILYTSWIHPEIFTPPE